MPTIHIIYHGADLDGKCSAAIAYHSLRAQYAAIADKTPPPTFRLYPWNYGYGSPLPSIDKEDKVFMLDCSLPPADMLAMRDRVGSPRFIWIDHHKTANAAAVEHGYANLYGHRVDDDRAACELTWEFFHPNTPIPTAVHYLGRYDVWKHSEDILNFQYGMRISDNQPQSATWPLLFGFGSQEVMGHAIVHTISEGRTIRCYQGQSDRHLVNAAAFPTILDGLPALAVNRLYGSSQMFDGLPTDHPAQVLIGFGWDKDKWRCTLWRGPSASPDLDLSAIARIHGGGGHPGAAGIQGPSLPFALP
jgi:oligoribonuclease NrnB/cAMP/cGMP phosphodiesterase (DHH superfamily)